MNENEKLSETVESSEWFDKAQKKQIEAMNDITRNSMQCCMPKHSLCDTCRKVFVCPMQHMEHREKCGLYEPLTIPEISEEEKEKVLELIKKAPLKIEREEKSMESAERIEITFKNGDTISYGKGEWDDYGFDGRAIMVKLKGAWIGIYNFDQIFCVELKEH